MSGVCSGTTHTASRPMAGAAHATGSLCGTKHLPRACGGHKCVARNVVLGALDAERVGEAEQPQFGRAVVGLAKVAVDAGGGGRHNHAAVLLLAHVGPGSARDEERAAQVDLGESVGAARSAGMPQQSTAQAAPHKKRRRRRAVPPAPPAPPAVPAPPALGPPCGQGPSRCRWSSAASGRAGCRRC